MAVMGVPESLSYAQIAGLPFAPWLLYPKLVAHSRCDLYFPCPEVYGLHLGCFGFCGLKQVAILRAAGRLVFKPYNRLKRSGMP